jgi:4-diphosphocytidyl-2-C-methyl-D-erythritol kinase
LANVTPSPQALRPEGLTLKAPAKINLSLKVTGRRADGYHFLETLMQKVSLYDELELRACAGGVHLRCLGESGVPENRGNLVFKAAELFLQATRERRGGSDAGVDITLIKRIPVAAGLGGGSSDAAATLRGLNKLYECGCSAEELATIGLQLGADVPFFLADASAAFATGIGEILRPVEPLCGLSVLLVNPGIPVSTRWVYQTFALTKKENESSLKNSQEGVVETLVLNGSGQTVSLPTVLVNDLEKVTLSRYPEVGRLKNEVLLNGAAQALMSGSGATVFGLFADRQCAVASYTFFKRRFHLTYLVSPVGEK